MPDSVKRRLSAKLAGIHLVNDLGGTGFTDMVFDERSRAVAGFIVLDMAVLNAHTANSWASWKDNTPFRALLKSRLTVEIEKERDNNRRVALLHLGVVNALLSNKASSGVPGLSVLRAA
jgi:hypothetical protein